MTLLANASRLGCADTGRAGTSRPVFIDLVAEVVPDSDFHQVREMLPESENDENWGQLFEIVDAGGLESTTQSYAVGPVDRGLQGVPLTTCAMRDAAARIAILGGTFDPIHNGHRALLHKAFQTASQVGPSPSHVIVGLTSPSLAAQTRQRQSHVEAIKPYDEREVQLRETLNAIGEAYTASVEIIELTDPREPAATDADIDALVVSPEASAQRRAHEINERRLERELTPLEVHTAPFVVAEDGNRISSTRIRNGEIDVHGRLLTNADRV